MKRNKLELRSSKAVLLLEVMILLGSIPACQKKDYEDIPKLWINGTFIDPESGKWMWTHLSQSPPVTPDKVITLICKRKMGSFADGDAQLRLAELLLGLDADPIPSIAEMLQSDDVEIIAAGLLVAGYMGDLRSKSAIERYLNDERKLPIGYDRPNLGEVAKDSMTVLQGGGLRKAENINQSLFGKWTRTSND